VYYSAASWVKQLVDQEVSDILVFEKDLVLVFI